MTDLIRPSLESFIKKTKTDDEEILLWLKPLAKKLEIPVEEVALNLHFQHIFRFDNIYALTRIEYFEE